MSDSTKVCTKCGGDPQPLSEFSQKKRTTESGEVRMHLPVLVRRHA